MSTSLEIRVSVDIGCRNHSVAVGLSDGRLLEQFDIAHHAHGFDEFFSRIEAHQRRYPGEVSVAMEGYNGFAARSTRWFNNTTGTCSTSTT